MAKVSVRIPSFNCDPRLSNAIESVLNQSFLDYDLVVVDNSVDHSLWQETKALTERYCLPAIHNPTPGLAENWNYCIKSCQGQFVLILHMDDELLPSMLEKSVAFLNATPNAGLVHSDVLDLTPGGRNLLRRTQEKPVLKAGTEALMKFMTSNNLACSSVMVRRECYDRLGYFLTGNPSPDLEMWARIGKDYDIGHLDEPLVKVTLHLDSSGPRLLLSTPPEEVEIQWCRLFERMLSYLPEEERATGWLAVHRQMAAGLESAGDKAWRLGRWEQGQRFFRLARKHTSIGAWLVAYLKSALKTPLYSTWQSCRVSFHANRSRSKNLREER